MTRNEIEGKLRQIIVQVTNTEIAPEAIPPGKGMLELLHIDSLMALEIIVQIEQAFQVAIDDDDFVFTVLDSPALTVDFIQKSASQLAAVSQGELDLKFDCGFYAANRSWH